VALLGAAVAVIAFRLTISPDAEPALELAVALLLILLGGHVLLRALGNGPSTRTSIRTMATSTATSTSTAPPGPAAFRMARTGTST
jgi:ABC-type nickel/cobalt efflux system permease component RcnA